MAKRNIQVELQFLKGERELAFLKSLLEKPEIPVNINIPGLDKLSQASKQIQDLNAAFIKLE